MSIQFQIPLLLLLLTSFLLLLATGAPAPPSCTDELVSFSPCLAYVSLPPNKISDTTSNECCDVVSNFLVRGHSNCFCYLTLQPSIFGFPMNHTRVVSLPFICVSTNNLSLPLNFTSRDSVCSGSRALPPLQSSRGSDVPDPVNSNPPYKDSSDAPSPEQESYNSPPMPPPELNFPAPPSETSFPALPPLTPDEDSSSADTSKIRCYLLGVVFTSVAIILVQANAVIYLK